MDCCPLPRMNQGGIMVAMVSIFNRVSKPAPLIPILEDKHTNASPKGTTPATQAGVSTFIFNSQEEPMQELTHEEEMQVNRSLAKEFITQHLDIKATDKNVEALARFIFELESKEHN
jgi:hypothetical protein